MAESKDYRGMVLVLLNLPDTATDEQIDEAYEANTEPAEEQVTTETETETKKDGNVDATETMQTDDTSEDDDEMEGNAMRALKKRRKKGTGAYPAAVE